MSRCACCDVDNEAEEEEVEEEDVMETEDRDNEGAEKPTSITFDPSLPTSHAVSNARHLPPCCLLPSRLPFWGVSFVSFLQLLLC